LYDKWTRRPWGTFMIRYQNGQKVSRGYLDDYIKVIIQNPDAIVSELGGKLSVRQSDGRTSMLDLIMEDALPERAKEFMGALIVFYQRYELENVYKVAQKVRAFINERQNEIGQQLNTVDIKVEGIQATVNGGVENSGAYMTGKMAAETEAQAAMLAKQSLLTLKENATASDGKMLSAQGVEDGQIQGLITEYNKARSEERRVGK